MGQKIEQIFPHSSLSFFTKQDIHMESKHMKRCSTSLVIRKVEIKTIMRYYYTPIRMANVKNIWTIPSVDEDTEQLEPSYIVGRNTEWYSQFGKWFGSFL